MLLQQLGGGAGSQQPAKLLGWLAGATMFGYFGICYVSLCECLHESWRMTMCMLLQQLGGGAGSQQPAKLLGWLAGATLPSHSWQLP
jgi:hypothetical protein